MSNLIRTTYFLNKPDQIRTKTKKLQSQIIVKVLGAIKQKDLNRIAKVDYGYLFLLEENLSVINVISPRHHCQIFTTMYVTFTPILQ
jgi:hypothetical protein